MKTNYLASENIEDSFLQTQIETESCMQHLLILIVKISSCTSLTPVL